MALVPVVCKLCDTHIAYAKYDLTEVMCLECGEDDNASATTTQVIRPNKRPRMFDWHSDPEIEAAKSAVPSLVLCKRSGYFLSEDVSDLEPGVYKATFGSTYAHRAYVHGGIATSAGSLTSVRLRIKGAGQRISVHMFADFAVIDVPIPH